MNFFHELEAKYGGSNHIMIGKFLASVQLLKGLSSCFVRRPQNLTKSSPSIWHLQHTVKSMVKITSIFVAFLENTNFNTDRNNFENSYYVL